jgi:hypothetical protein
VRFIGTVPPSVQTAPKDQIISNTHIDVDIVTGVFGVTSSDHPGHGPIWGGDQAVDKYLKYGVGLYHVTGKATGAPGSWSCDGDAYVQLKDGNPLGKPVGDVAAAMMLVGLAGAAMATRADAPDASARDDYDDEPVTPHGDSEQDHIVAQAAEHTIINPDRGAEGAAGMACLLLIVIAISATVLSKDFAAGAVGAAGVARPSGRRRVWSHGHPIVGFFSGLIMGIGITVLMQQFAVWPLTRITAIVFPVVVAVICSLRAWLGRPYTFGAS